MTKQYKKDAQGHFVKAEGFSGYEAQDFTVVDVVEAIGTLQKQVVELQKQVTDLKKKDAINDYINTRAAYDALNLHLSGTGKFRRS